MDFTNFNLDPSIMAGVKVLRYTTPTPIQEKAIPVIMQGKDIIGLAQTGTGKTAAFVLPVLQRLLKSPRRRVGALIISPTRELAEQTTENINYFSYQTGLRGISVYGGVSMYNQVEALRRGVELVVACPGRLLDHMMKGSIDLSHVEVLVIDEADRMFDMGFLPDIRNIVRCLTNPHQTLLFSATMPPDIRKLVQEVLHDPVTIQIGEAAPVNSVAHALFPVKPHLKLQLLKEILKNTDSDSVLVFTRTKHRVDKVAEALSRDGYSVASLQGDMVQSRRQAAIEGFKNGDLKILVATDIAARGLDILSITHVINFDMPDTTDAYTHRIGRTGRVNNKGDAFTLVTNEDREMIKSLEKIFKKPIETRQIPGFDYNASEPPRSAVTGYERGSRGAGRGSRSTLPSSQTNRRQSSRTSEPPAVKPEAPSRDSRGYKSPHRERTTVSTERQAEGQTVARPGYRLLQSSSDASAEAKPVKHGISNQRPAPEKKAATSRSSNGQPRRYTRRSGANEVSRVRFAAPESITHGI
jgi:ATP-dependent RNA helicase RhlE